MGGITGNRCFLFIPGIDLGRNYRICCIDGHITGDTVDHTVGKKTDRDHNKNRTKRKEILNSF